MAEIKELTDTTASETCRYLVEQVNGTHEQASNLIKRLHADNICSILFAAAMVAQQSVHCGTLESIALRTVSRQNAEETKNTFLGYFKHGARITGGLIGVVTSFYAMKQYASGAAAAARATQRMARPFTTAGEMVHGTVDAKDQGVRAELQATGSALTTDKQNAGQTNQRTEGMVDANLQKANESSNTRHQTFTQVMGG